MRVTQELRAHADPLAHARHVPLRPRPEHGRQGPPDASPASAGQTIRIRHAEVLNPDGVDLHREPAQRQGDRPLHASPAGARDVRAVLHLPRLPLRRGHRRAAAEAPEVTGVVMGTDGELVSELDTSSRPGRTSCTATSSGASAATSSRSRPTRRRATSAWAGPATSTCSRATAVYNMDSQAFLGKWLQDLRDTQTRGRGAPGRRPGDPRPVRRRLRPRRLDGRRRPRAVDAVAGVRRHERDRARTTT